MSLEHELREKLRRIEALYAGATTEGERMAAKAALERIRKRLSETERVEQPVEFKFTFADPWARKLFVALCKRYGLQPYRKARQRTSTIMVRAPRSFVHTTLWPEFQDVEDALRVYLNEVTERIIREEVFGDMRETER